MRRIRPEAPNHRRWLSWLRACTEATVELERIVSTGGAATFVDKLYRRKSIRKLYFFSPNAPFFGKCAYCESPLELIDGDIDHFRPKAEVRDENGDLVVVVATGARHPGYYWLAYHWKNLLPSCKTCNQIFKGAKFPVLGIHATSPAEVAQEQPLLLNPLSEDPEEDPIKHLKVDETGIIAGITPRGDTTIKVLGLRRDPLQTRRRSAYLEAQALWRRLNDGEPQARADLKAIVEGRRPYHLAQKAALAELASRAGISATG